MLPVLEAPELATLPGDERSSGVTGGGDVPRNRLWEVDDVEDVGESPHWSADW